MSLNEFLDILPEKEKVFNNNIFISVFDWSEIKLENNQEVIKAPEWCVDFMTSYHKKNKMLINGEDHKYFKNPKMIKVKNVTENDRIFVNNISDDDPEEYFMFKRKTSCQQIL